MTQKIEAIYEDKVLKPLTKIEGVSEHQRVEITLHLTPEPAHYDFSDIVGKLQWNGDGVKAQRTLRDEWQ